jgi:uncharacterized protein (DUF885 family)
MLTESLTPIAKKKMEFNKKLKDGELDNIVDASRRVKKLTKSPIGHSVKNAIDVALKDFPKVNKKNLEEYIKIYGLNESSILDEAKGTWVLVEVNSGNKYLVNTMGNVIVEVSADLKSAMKFKSEDDAKAYLKKQGNLVKGFKAKAI